jgi:hypothetical protein
MANVIKPKRSNTASNVPTTANTTSGELAVNMADKKIYINNGTSIVQVGAGTLPALSGVVITTPATNQVLQYNGTNWINATASGSGTVTSITAGTGLSGGTITTTGTIALANTAVTAGTYTNTNITVDAQGRITAASSGSAGGVASFNTRTGAVTLTSGDVTGALGFTPYNSTNPNGYTSNTGTVTSITATAGTGISISGSPITTSGTLTITNTAPDQVVAFTNGTGISVTGTYPNFTVTNTAPSSGGTVTSVSGTAPISVATGTSTPAISITQATTSTNGYLSSTDWNTFNNKTSNTGTVTSVAMTVPTGLSISGTPITTSGTLAVTLTAGYSIPTTASQTNWDSAYTDRLKWDGGATGLVSATGRTSLGGTTVGQNFFTLTNPSAITFPRINADNSVSALDAATFRTAIGAGTSSTTGTVTSVGGTGTVAGITLTGTVTTSGSLTLGGTFALPTGQVTTRTLYQSFTATAAQTTFTPTTAYTASKIEVYCNGVKMVNGSDVTVTSGTSVVFAAGLPVNTRVDVVYPT